MMGRTSHTREKPSRSHYRLEDTSDTSWISRESQPTCCWSSIWCDVGYWRCTSSLDQEACALHGRSSAPSFGCAGALVLKLAVCESHLVIGAEVTVFFNSFSTQWSARKCKENDVCVCVYTFVSNQLGHNPTGSRIVVSFLPLQTRTRSNVNCKYLRNVLLQPYFIDI